MPLRLWLGWQWFDSGWGKISNPAWMETGMALQSFWQRALAIPEQGRPAIAYDWYRSVLQLMLDEDIMSGLPNSSCLGSY